MKLSYTLKLALTNINEKKFKSKLTLFIIILFMILICSFFSFKNSFYNFMDDWLNKDYNFKLIQVNTENKNYSEVLADLNKLNDKHISNIFKDNTELKVQASLNNEDVEFYGNFDGFNYKIIEGKDIKDKYDIVCPNYMIGGDWTSEHDKNKYVKMNVKIGDILHMQFKKIYVVSETERKVLNTYNYDLKLVGTFDSEKELIGYNKCFISVELFNETLKESEIVYSDEFLNSRVKYDDLEVLVLVDNHKNVDEVRNKIENIGYKTYIPEVDLSSYETIFKIIYVATIIIIFTSIVCMFYFIRITLSESKKDIALYQILGYDFKDIKKIYTIQYFILFTISLIIATIISLCLLAIANSIMANDPNYSVLTIRLSLKEMLTYYIFLLLLAYFVIMILLKKIKKSKSLILLMGE